MRFFRSVIRRRKAGSPASAGNLSAAFRRDATRRRTSRILAAALLGCALLFVSGGCGGGQQPAASANHENRPSAKVASSPTRRKTRQTAAHPTAPKRHRPPRTEDHLAAAPLPEGPRSLADLLTDEGAENSSEAAEPSQTQAAAEPKTDQIPIDDTQAAVAGIRKLAGRHLTLYTDVPIGPKADDLPRMFDLAVPQWCEYFHVDPSQADQWHVTGFLMQDKTRFQSIGMMPADLPLFRNGYHRGGYIWIYDQPDTYYTQHLVLHEGTHAFMYSLVGGLGPPWYAEGMAEFLGTHRWQNGQLTLGYFPKSKSETPGWGRIKIIRDELAAGRGMMIERIMQYGPQAHLENAPYGWCWGLAAFLDAHPLSQKVFRQLYTRVRTGDVTPWLRQQLQNQWSALSEDWQIFVMNIQYGYDIARAAVVRKPAVPLPAGGASATIVADRGWQSTGIRLEPGVTYQLDAVGRYQIRETSGGWWCEPDGVTIATVSFDFLTNASNSPLVFGLGLALFNSSFTSANSSSVKLLSTPAFSKSVILTFPSPLAAFTAVATFAAFSLALFTRASSSPFV